ncbi:MAG: hypothetical protein ISN29_07660 [Gammaproteobacteria bacterium AqS3]|nr:hypothetical protein [Gammaproteobacteria bacterium AqS3]
MQPDHHIVSRSDLRRWVIWGVLGACALTTLAALAGIYYGDRAQRLATLGLEELSQRIEQLHAENHQLRSEAAALNAQLSVDVRTETDLRESLNRLIAENEELQRENAFYRGIVHQSDTGKRGLLIRNFDLLPTPLPDVFEYRFALTIEGSRPDRALKGKLRFSLSGEREGEPAVLSMREFTQPAMRSLAYEFKYLKTISGRIKLPAGFEPLIFIIEEVPRRRRSAPAPKHLFNWVLAKEV